jgi:hypothetical protein
MSSNSRLNKLRFFNFIKTLLEELPHLRPLYYNWQSPTTFKEHAAKIRVHEFTIPGLARDHVIKLTVTEDMCPESIDHLWLAFGCPSPELFGLHLDNQKSLGSYNGIYSSQINEWYDPGFAKRYYSIRWYRPGLYRQDSLGYQYEELVKSVYNDIRTLPRVAAMNNSSRWSPFFMTRDGEKLRNAFRPQEIFSNSNILRKSIMLPVDTDELKKRDTAGCPCLWEERATIYVTKERNDSKSKF